MYILNNIIYTNYLKKIIDESNKIKEIYSAFNIDEDYLSHEKYILSILNEYLQEKVKHIFKITRKLTKIKFKFNIISHSGLLLQTTNNNFFILEYGSGSTYMKNYIYLYKISKDNIINNKIINNNYIWKVYKGNKLKKKYTIFEIYNIMKNKMKKHKYNLYYWNCHIAQEKTRKELGIKVNSYIILYYSLLIIILLLMYKIIKYIHA